MWSIVIIPTFTFIASANAVCHCGADPWLMDISNETWCLDAELVQRQIQENCEMKNGILTYKATGKRITALISVYTLGNVPDMKAMRKLLMN